MVDKEKIIQGFYKRKQIGDIISGDPLKGDFRKLKFHDIELFRHEGKLVVPPWTHPTGKVPKSVLIVALGVSHRHYTFDRLSGGPKSKYDEVWTVNTGYRLFKEADVVFSMDDLAYCERVDPDYAVMARDPDIPFITTTKYSDYTSSNLYEYPLDFVAVKTSLALKEPDNVYLTNTIPYMLAYAVALEVPKLFLVGADYHYGGSPVHEEGKNCCEFWMGFARGRGLDFGVCPETTLLDALKGQPLYGYIVQPKISVKDIGVQRIPVKRDKRKKRGKKHGLHSNKGSRVQRGHRPKNKKKVSKARKRKALSTLHSKRSARRRAARGAVLRGRRQSVRRAARLGHRSSKKSKSRTTSQVRAKAGVRRVSQKRGKGRASSKRRGARKSK